MQTSKSDHVSRPLSTVLHGLLFFISLVFIEMSKLNEGISHQVQLRSALSGSPWSLRMVQQPLFPVMANTVSIVLPHFERPFACHSKAASAWGFYEVRQVDSTYRDCSVKCNMETSNSLMAWFGQNYLSRQIWSKICHILLNVPVC